MMDKMISIKSHVTSKKCQHCGKTLSAWSSGLSYCSNVRCSNRFVTVTEGQKLPENTAIRKVTP